MACMSVDSYFTNIVLIILYFSFTHSGGVKVNKNWLKYLKFSKSYVLKEMSWPLKGGFFLCILNISKVQFGHIKEYQHQNLTAASSLMIYIIFRRTVIFLIMLVYLISAKCFLHCLIRSFFLPLTLWAKYI